MTWGFTPPQGSRPIINARAETITQKPMFRGAFQSQRCLVPANGYFEWQKEEGKKDKKRFRLNPVEEGRMMMAGIYNARGEFAIITQAPNAVVAPIHDRMPVMIPSLEMQTLWLHEDAVAELILRMQPEVHLAAQAET